MLSSERLYFFIFRLFGIILLFSPSLGLFDILHHGRMGSLHVDIIMKTSIFDESDHGKQVSFHDAWEPFRLNSITDFLDIPVIGVSFILVSVGCMHIWANSFLMRLTTKNTSFSRSILHGLHSIITPPLHTDWEMFYRNTDGKKSVIESWHR